MDFGAAMHLDPRVCSRARLARDARFDGKFFIGVLTTKIYCRPICRSRTSKEANVRYFPSAAAAANSGFRPCLLCHPELSPETPAIAGTRNTVNRALRLINECGLETGIEALAAQLGVGSRHLSRLFQRHLGASPSAVAHTRRLQFAKRLIDQTDLSMNQIALASGFGSVRRFNGAIRSVYNRTPSAMRSSVRKTPCEPKNQYLFRLSFRPPYDWRRLLEFLASHLAPGVECIDGGTYRRTFSLDEHRGYVEVCLRSTGNELDVRVQIGEPRLLFTIIDRVRAIFDVDADWTEIARTLESDPLLRSSVKSNPGLRVPGCWDGFELAIRAVVEQQTSVNGIDRTELLVKSFGRPFAPARGLTHLFPLPETLADVDIESIGFPERQARSIRDLSRAFCGGKVGFQKVVGGDYLRDRLSKLPGIGESTSQWLAMRVFRDPDAFPFLDPAIGRAFGRSNSKWLEKHSFAWRPWRAYAALYVLCFADGIRANRKRGGRLRREA